MPTNRIHILGPHSSKIASQTGTKRGYARNISKLRSGLWAGCRGAERGGKGKSALSTSTKGDKLCRFCTAEVTSVLGMYIKMQKKMLSAANKKMLAIAEHM